MTDIMTIAGSLRAATLGGLILVAAAGAGWAQSKDGPTLPPNEREVFLVRQDFSDCTNSNVSNDNSPQIGGTMWVVRNNNGTTTVKVAMTASPNTSYNIYLKCVRQIGAVVTGDEGTAIEAFSFPTNLAGNTFAFDVYPTGAPAGNKFQSARVSFD